MNRAQRRSASRDISRQLAAGAVDLKARAEEPPKRLTMTLGYCWSEDRGVSGYWHGSILRLLQGFAGRVGFREVPVDAGSYLARGRNLIVERFLQTDDEYLLFTDTDVVFQPEDLDLLLEADASIAGALYFNAATGSAPYSTALVPEVAPVGDAEVPTGAYVPFELPELPPPPAPPGEEADEAAIQAYGVEVAAYQALLDGPDYQPRVVAGVGMGLTLIKRQVVEAVCSTYKRPFEVEDDRDEDLVFCLRAAEFGFETKVVPHARIGHVTRAVI